MRTAEPTPGGDPHRQKGGGSQEVGTARGLVDNRYRLLRPLGRGGMGVVWEAHDTRLGRRVAIKELLFRGAVDPETQAQWVARAKREAQAIARIGHEHVVAVHDVIEADGQVWIVMEQVNPRSLSDVLRDHERLPAHRAAQIGLEVLRGLRAVHAAGVLHRDVKPHNVLFRKDGRAVLMDFGIATFEGAAQVTRRHETVGTPQYLPPELASPWEKQPRQATPASDLWSLGVTLYETVEGRIPFRGPTPIEVLEAVREEEPPPMEHAGPLRPLIEGLLEKDPDKRLAAARAEEMLRHVAQERPENRTTGASRGAPAEPAPPRRADTSPLRAPRPHRRVPWRLVGIGALVAAVLAGGGLVAVHLLGDRSPSLSHSPTFRRAMARGYLRVGVKKDQPGLSQKGPDGKYHGFDIDIANAIARGLGFKRVKFLPADTGSREYVLTKGSVDMVVASYSITPEREKSVAFAGPYYIASQDFLVRRGDAWIKGKESLAHKPVCTVAGSTTEAELRRMRPAPEIIYRDEYGKCVDALLAGDVDAVSTDDIILSGFQEAHPSKLVLLHDPNAGESYGVGLPKGDPALKRAVCAALRKDVASGAWRRSHTRWLKKLEGLYTVDHAPGMTECGS
jgi:eukaryotic-like serine/threonine-protein kinase